jgi:hypothetical protein
VNSGHHQEPVCPGAASSLRGISQGRSCAQPARDSESPSQAFAGRAGRRVLSRLGLNVDAPSEQYALAYQLLLPAAAEGGYYRWLRDQARAMNVRLFSPDQELRLLAGALHVPGPDDRLPGLRLALERAQERLGDLPSHLSERARLVLVRRLACEPEYSRLLEDALVEAVEEQDD